MITAIARPPKANRPDWPHRREYPLLPAAGYYRGEKQERVVQRYITVEKVKYRIRGPYTANQLRRLYPESILPKYPGTKLTLRGWLVGFGKVHSAVNSKR